MVPCDMPETGKFPSLDSCQEKFLWTYKEVDLAPHPVVGVVLQVGDTEKFPQALGYKSLDLFFRVSKQGQCFTAVEEDGGDKFRYLGATLCKMAPAQQKSASGFPQQRQQ